MSIGWKLVIIFCMMGVFPLLCYGLWSHQLMMKDFDLLEERLLDKQEVAAQTYIASKEEQLLIIGRDYALWDELVTAVENNDSAWIRANVTGWLSSPASSYGLNTVIVGDEKGKIIDSYGVPASFKGNLWGNLLTSLGLSGRKVATFVATAQGPMLIAVHPIRHEDGRGPVYGVMVLGSLINMDMLKNIDNFSDSQWLLYSRSRLIGATAAGIAEKVQAVRENQFLLRKVFLTGGKATGRLNNENSFVIIPFTDLNGNVVAALEAVVSHRDMLEISGELHNSLLLFFLGSLLAAVVLAWAVAMFLTCRFKRILGIAQAVAGGDYQVELPKPKGKDEFSQLEAALGAILQTIIQQIQALTNTNKALDEMHKKAELASFTDELTGLFNYRYLMEYGNQVLQDARNRHTPVGVLMLDLDGFKQYNDLNGHLAGNLLLRRVAGMLRRKCRQTDLPIRYGGDEFVVILPDAGLEGAVQVAEKIQKSIEKLGNEYRNMKNKAGVTCSIGISIFPDDGDKLEELIKAADQALYAAKWQGKNCVCRYRSADQ